MKNKNLTIKDDILLNKFKCSEFHSSAIFLGALKQSWVEEQDRDYTREESIEQHDPEDNVKSYTEEKSNSNLVKYLDSVKELLNEASSIEDENLRQNIQLKLETNWIQIIEEKLEDDKFFIENKQGYLLSSLKAAKVTLNIMESRNYLNKKFPEFKDKKDLNKIDYLLITFSLCITLYSRLSYNNLAIKVGEELIYLMYSTEILNKGKGKNKPIFMTFKEYKIKENIDLKLTVKLGDFFMSILQQFPHEIFNREIISNSYYTSEPYRLSINQDYFEEIKNNIIINPNTLPMICKPIKWSDEVYGGFLSNKNRGVDIITGIDSNNVGHDHIVENKESIYKTVNYLNSIKFCVNTTLLNYLLSPEGSYILENVKVNDPLQQAYTLKISELYKNTYFYLNTHADWRGRIYTQSFFLTYQGGDLSTSLLNFWEGEDITELGKFYLYIYGANCHNEKDISKKSYEVRLKWVNNNYNKIINLDKDLILSAENPFKFTAFCLNMAEIHKNPKAIIKTPVFLDATCSGIQHLSGLMKDLELGSKTNLTESTIKDDPNDIYSYLLKAINKAINKYGLEDPEFALLSCVKLKRREVKTAIMTKIYNVTVFGISRQLQGIFLNIKNKDLENFEDYFYNKPLKDIQKDLERDFEKSIKNNSVKFICPGIDGKNVILNRRDVFKIASIINDQIFVVFPSLNIIYNYFIDVAKLSLKLGIPLTWFTPSGLKITQKYFQTKKTKISVSIFGKNKKLVYNERDNSNKINEGKQIQAIIPNIIHSMDASHLINVIKSASDKKFYPLITIHDCFGTLPNKMGELEYNIKKEFILLYSNNTFLKNFHKRFIQNIKDNNFDIEIEGRKSYINLDHTNKKLEIPIMPKIGQLDIDNIINSKYMIT